jgi:hypothetical protein
MADPEAARLTQLRNIQSKTGRTIAQLHAAVAASGLGKVGERRSWLMEQFALGYGDANAVALSYGKPLPALEGSAAAPAQTEQDDPLAAIYAGAKAHLRPLHVAVLEMVRGFGPFEEAPKKSYTSLRRKKQFAMVGPATKDLLEIGLNIKSLAPAERLRALPAGGMCQYAVRIAATAELDPQLRQWLKAAYDAAG